MYVVGYVVENGVGGGIAIPLGVVAMGAHDLPGMVDHGHDLWKVVGGRIAYHFELRALLGLRFVNGELRIRSGATFILLSFFLLRFLY